MFRELPLNEIAKNSGFKYFKGIRQKKLSGGEAAVYCDTGIQEHITNSLTAEGQQITTCLNHPGWCLNAHTRG